MPDMICTKGMWYGTRRLQPDDRFEATTRDAKVLAAIGKARYQTVDGRATETVSPVRAEDERPALRAAYAQKSGKKPFAGWDAATLKAKIADLDKG